MYRQVINFLNGQVSTEVIQRVSDEAFIPFDMRNGDYRDYLAWLGLGNEPELPE